MVHDMVLDSTSSERVQRDRQNVPQLVSPTRYCVSVAPCWSLAYSRLSRLALHSLDRDLRGSRRRPSMVLLVLLCCHRNLHATIWNGMRDWAVLAVYTDTGSLHALLLSLSYCFRSIRSCIVTQRRVVCLKRSCLVSIQRRGREGGKDDEESSTWVSPLHGVCHPVLRQGHSSCRALPTQKRANDTEATGLDVDKLRQEDTVG